MRALRKPPSIRANVKSILSLPHNIARDLSECIARSFIIYMCVYVYSTAFSTLCTPTSSWHEFRRVYPRFHQEHFNRDRMTAKIVYIAEFSRDNGSACHVYAYDNGLYANVSRETCKNRMPQLAPVWKQKSFHRASMALGICETKEPFFFFLSAQYSRDVQPSFELAVTAS